MLGVSMVLVHHNNKHDDDDKEDTWDELWKCTCHISCEVQHKGALSTWHFSCTHFKHRVGVHETSYQMLLKLWSYKVPKLSAFL